jgi:hypothetical protein
LRNVVHSTALPITTAKIISIQKRVRKNSRAAMSAIRKAAAVTGFTPE